MERRKRTEIRQTTVPVAIDTVGESHKANDFLLSALDHWAPPEAYPHYQRFLALSAAHNASYPQVLEEKQTSCTVSQMGLSFLICPSQKDMVYIAWQ
jgi:hypothetical protein